MKKKKVLAVVALAGVLAIGGTLAYFNQTMTAENKFDTGKYGSTIVEEFHPEDGANWKPGVEVNKDVTVANTGNQPIVARIKLDETWIRKSGDAIIENKAEGKVIYKDPSQADVADGLVTGDTTVVKKILGSADWVAGDDGWYYYNGVIGESAETGKFLDGVQLASDVDLGKITNKKYYTTETVKPAVSDLTKWTEYTDILPKEATFNLSVAETDALAMGYSDADYTLKVTTQTVQATDKAVAAAFGDKLPNGLNWNLTAEALTK